MSSAQAHRLTRIVTRVEVAICTLPVRPAVVDKYGKHSAGLMCDLSPAVLGSGASSTGHHVNQAAALEDFFLGETTFFIKQTAWWVFV